MIGPVAAQARYRDVTRPAAAALREALKDPRPAQERIFEEVLFLTASSAQGRALGLRPGMSLAEFRSSVPVRPWQDVAPLVDRVAAGEERVLTSERVEFLEPSGGTSGASKLVPFTAGLRRQFSASLSAWTHDLAADPALRGTRSYWSVSPPAARDLRITPGGIPVGLDHDAQYFPAELHPLLAEMLVLPGVVSEVPTMEATRSLTLLGLLAAPDLGMVSVWSPSFWVVLVEHLDEQWERLLEGLELGPAALGLGLDGPLAARIAAAFPSAPSRAREFRALSGPPEDLTAIWPRLSLMSCWTHGEAASSLPALSSRLPGVRIQPKGLLATEGVVSTPLPKFPAPVAAVTSHLLEFVPAGGGEPLLVNELEEGGVYTVLLTTAGGLLRYALGDRVQVTGFVESTPMLVYVGRQDGRTDLAGEKLAVAHVEAVLAAAAASERLEPSFLMLAPAPAGRHYQLFVEAAPAEAVRLAARVEELLLRDHSYRLCRSLGQLERVEPRAVPGALQKYEAALLSQGRRAGTGKPVALAATSDWEDHLTSSTTTHPDRSTS